MPGLSFLPSSNPSPQDQASATALSPGQSAISTISLNLPKILGAKPLTNSNLLGGGTTGATHTGIDPQQIVLQALMQSAMSQPGADGNAGSPDDELRRRLEAMFGQPSGAPAQPDKPDWMPTPTPMSPPVSSPPPAPVFTPGQTTNQSNPFGVSPYPVAGFATNQELRRR